MTPAERVTAAKIGIVLVAIVIGFALGGPLIGGGVIIAAIIMLFVMPTRRPRRRRWW